MPPRKDGLVPIEVGVHPRVSPQATVTTVNTAGEGNDTRSGTTTTAPSPDFVEDPSTLRR